MLTESYASTGGVCCSNDKQFGGKVIAPVVGGASSVISRPSIVIVQINRKPDGNSEPIKSKMAVFSSQTTVFCET